MLKMIIHKDHADVWWKYLETPLYSGTLLLFETLAVHCEENCEHCHLILCKRLKDPNAPTS